MEHCCGLIFSKDTVTVIETPITIIRTPPRPNTETPASLLGIAEFIADSAILLDAINIPACVTTSNSHTVIRHPVSPLFNMAETVLLEYRGPVAIITLNNPKKLNAQSKDGFYQIAKYLREIATHEEVLITVLTGAGRYFSA